MFDSLILDDSNQWRRHKFGLRGRAWLKKSAEIFVWGGDVEKSIEIFHTEGVRRKITIAFVFWGVDH